MASQSSTATYPARAYSQANPIDLTLEDDDEDIHVTERMSKRHCTEGRQFMASCSTSASSTPSAAYSRQSPSGLSPAMSHSSLAPALPNAPSGSRTPQPAQSPSYYREHYDSLSPNEMRAAQFQGPSNSAAFFNPRHLGVSPVNPLNNPLHSRPMQDRSISSSNGAVRQVIDLTSSPSPPPQLSRPTQPPPPPPQYVQPMHSSAGNTPNDLPPKTPVCIGVLAATALVLYPIPYITPTDLGAQDYDWAPVRLNYEHVDDKSACPSDNINIRPPSVKGPNGEIIPGEHFAVVEAKVATHLGPMLGKGLIRLDAKIRRSNRMLPMLPLQLLVFTPKGNIPVVSQYLFQHGLYLEHPSIPSDVQTVSAGYYLNPHNPPPGGHARAQVMNNRPGFMGSGGNTISRWSAPAVSGRSIEVQRSQVDELFKSLKGGDEIEEADPPPEVATKLYPHQLKAVTFLLAREQELSSSPRRQTSLWQERTNPLSGQSSWVHIVTHTEEFQKPVEAKGAILADDMGLGKTITCVSLIAATLRSARAFAESPLTPPPTPPPQFADPALSASHFQGSVWGIPPPSADSKDSSSKGKGKMAKEQDRVEAQYARACRIKMKSRATLIICPLSTVVNWEEQFKEHWRGDVFVYGGTEKNSLPACQSTLTSFMTPTGSQVDIKTEATTEKKPPPGRVREGTPLRVYVYHGNARRLEPAFLADFDAVITTYSTLASEFSKQSKMLEAPEEEEEEEGVSSEGFIEVDGTGQPLKPAKGKKAKKRKKNAGSAAEATSPLQSVHWFRVVLDEAHSIKETSTVGCRASCDLAADRRLCLTGTPVQNKLDDVYALIKFLRLTPFDDKNVWNEYIGTPVKYAQPLGVARLQTLMKCITLRRTKESRAEDGKRILSLPPRHDELRYLQFDAQEQEIYNQFFTESKAEFHELTHKNEVMKNYVGILQKILRLRQICDHYELVRNKGVALPGDATPAYEDVVATISRDGINLQRAAVIFSLLKEAGTAQCVECSCELAAVEAPNEGIAEVDAPPAPAKRGRKPKAAAAVTSRASTRQNSPSAPQPVLTRCQHLFCMECFRNATFPGWPNVPAEQHRCCSVCQAALLPSDAVLINLDCSTLETMMNGGASKKKGAKKEKRQKGIALEDFHPSTKVRALLGDLLVSSKANPNSANYDPSSVEVEMVDNEGNSMDDGIIKTVVFSQWTSMLDKIEDALEVANIRYDRLDGTMKRDERTRAMEALKHDPACEVLLVSLKAGGVGLNLTAAQRVYLMDPYWNPAVENQAVDRIHRLGQTRPVTTIKLIIDNTIEARLLEVQKKKTELANLTLGPPLSKSDLQARRLEELQQLFAS